MIFEPLSKYIDSKKQELIKFAKELISIPTINPPGDNYEKIVTVLENKCKTIGIDTKRIVVPDQEMERSGIKKGSPRINLLGRWDVQSRKTLHINGHYDVVPATSNWHTHPFKPVVKNGRLYGRGAEDMKGDISCMLFAVEALKRCGITPKVNVELSFTPDEETGGRTGLGYLVRKRLIKADYALGEGYAGDFICIGNKGILWLEVEILGKSAHGSRPYKGINAFEKMVEVCSGFNKLKRKVEKRKTNFYTKHPADRFATFMLGGMSRGGNKTNTVPDRAVFSIDRRILPEESVELARQEIIDVVRKVKRNDMTLRLKLKVAACDEPCISCKDSKIAGAIKVAIRQILGKEAHFAIMAGGTDLRYFIWKGIPSVGYSVSGGQNWHGDDEFVFIDGLVETAKIYAMTIMGL